MTGTTLGFKQITKLGFCFWLFFFFFPGSQTVIFWRYFEFNFVSFPDNSHLQR